MDSSKSYSRETKQEVATENMVSMQSYIQLTTNEDKI